jgi:predicted AlkP superfamily phosphohydrolase/phosphomutase
MTRLRRARHGLIYTGLLFAWLCPHSVHGQPATKAIIFAWDGTVPAFTQKLLNDGKLPNLAKLIAGGAFASDVIVGFPSKTAPGFASLMTGAPPRVTGISGNRVPREPRAQFTIVESLAGFSEAPLKAEPIWAAAQRGGKQVIVAHMPAFGNEQSEHATRFAGYNAIAGRDGIVTKRMAQNSTLSPWRNSPASDAPPIEFSFTAGQSKLFGLVIDDPADPRVGFDTVVIATRRSAAEIKARLKPAPAGAGGEPFWSAPFTVKVRGDKEGKIYFRLFDLQPDGSDFFLYFSRPALDIGGRAAASAGPAVRAFIGNGASFLYQTGGFGRTIANGGHGSAEARYLETIFFAQHQLMQTNRWAMEHLPWDLYLAYTPFPDEAEHAWRGHLDATLPTYRQELADKLAPLLEQVYRSCDDHLGALLAKRPPGALFALISDHGVYGAHKRVALNQALRQSELLSTDGQGRIDLAKTKVLYPTANNGYLLINSSDRKGGIVADDERAELVRKLTQVLFSIRDGERPVVTSIIDAKSDGAASGIGGDLGGDIYVELAPGYDFDPRMSSGPLIVDTEPYGTHGGNPTQPSMRTVMVLHGPGIRPGTKLTGVRLIDFAPTLARLLNIPTPKDATGRVLYEALTAPP